MGLSVCVFLVFFCCVVLLLCVLTEALLPCAPVAAMEATWLMMGEKFVGPESFS